MKAIVMSVGMVLLGLLAGFVAAVATRPDLWAVRRRAVLVATSRIEEGGEFNWENVRRSDDMPEKYIPLGAIDADVLWLLPGLTAKKVIRPGEYIFYDSIDLEHDLGNR